MAENTISTAYLGKNGNYTFFSFGDTVIRFRAPYSLEKYTEIKEWDSGYLVVSAKYSHNAEPEEEYIDLIPILEDLFFDAGIFLKPIKEVALINDSQNGFFGE